LSEILKISEQLLYNVKLHLTYSNEVSKLCQLNYENVVLELKTDNHKKTFWINIYNANYQIFAKDYNNQISKTIFSKKKICIGSKYFSLDCIEHGILRKGKYVVGFGFLFNVFYPKFIRKLKVNKLDYRIHFALNCGAVSCPPILVYKFENIENQLQLATQSFIESETSININEKKIKTSKLFLWFLGDFGSLNKVKLMIEEVFNMKLSKYKITFQKYNWEKKLHNFK
jgi:Protein of unknown function, DUF547